MVAARDYIGWIDHPSPIEAEWDELWRLYKIICELQAAAVEMPRLGELSDEDDPHFPESYDGIETSRPRLRSLNIPYATIYNVLGLDDEPVHGQLSGDLAEIYHELSTHMISFESGRVGDATFGWGQGFRAHWGKHANHALAAIHDHLLMGAPVGKKP